jgi:hypothetical protein
MATELVAMILGQHGGPSSTSRSEALRFSCWGSTVPEGQVVRPRPPGGCRRRNLLVGLEYSSMQLYELGGDTWSSPATGGRGTVLDCFFLYIFRVLSVKCEALTSNSWFVRTRDDKGLSCKMYLPHVIQ